MSISPHLKNPMDVLCLLLIFYPPHAPDLGPTIQPNLSFVLVRDMIVPVVRPAWRVSPADLPFHSPANRFTEFRNELLVDHPTKSKPVIKSGNS